MSSVYVTIPGYENHSLNIPGKISIKVGIYKGRKAPQIYVNGRYGKSQLHLSLYKKKINFERMKRIEKGVLSELKKKYKRQHGKKEHFLIPAMYTYINNFTHDVESLYNSYS